MEKKAWMADILHESRDVFYEGCDDAVMAKVEQDLLRKYDRGSCNLH
jgi:hypothetical protein